MKKITILGSTGSIGTQALELIEAHPERFSVTALTCGRNTGLLQEQIRRFRPEMVSVEMEADARAVTRQFPGLEVAYGEEGLIAAATYGDCDLLLSALVGIRGLAPTYAAIRLGRDVALANKETLVAGGQIVMDAVSKAKTALLPVDSEHSAIFQCLKGNEGQKVKRILLTASGGPFRGYSERQLAHVTVEQALRHPNWSMGNKITIDSATMMNKGLEVIEAHWLFDIPGSKIEPVVHPESIIHSMVEYEDQSILSQMGQPDMKVPISYALSYPDRLANDFPPVDFFKLGTLHFEPVDRKTFRCLDLAYRALEEGETFPAAMNAANEVLVQKFLAKKISFNDIPNTIEGVLEAHIPISRPGLEEILEVDSEVRGRLMSCC